VRKPLSHGTLWLAATALQALASEADARQPDETGGLLLGYRHSPVEAVVTEIIGPGPEAAHNPTNFQPDGCWQADELARRYEQEGRRLHYLGDWHTHPGGAATMSTLDRRTLQVIARAAQARCPQPVMAVLAGGDPWRLAAAQLTRYRRFRTTLGFLTIRVYD
jgi:integrative and conjugative element protein (TIGR02256 family)